MPKIDLNESRVKVITMLEHFGGRVSTNIGEAVVIGINAKHLVHNPSWMDSEASYDDCQVTFYVNNEIRVAEVNEFELSIKNGYHIDFLNN
jgi:hypothetical protein